MMPQVTLGPLVAAIRSRIPVVNGRGRVFESVAASTLHPGAVYPDDAAVLRFPPPRRELRARILELEKEAHHLRTALAASDRERAVVREFALELSRLAEMTFEQARVDADALVDELGALVRVTVARKAPATVARMARTYRKGGSAFAERVARLMEAASNA